MSHIQHRSLRQPPKSNAASSLKKRSGKRGPLSGSNVEDEADNNNSDNEESSDENQGKLSVKKKEKIFFFV